jgi:exonuclease VII small subunit
MSNKISEKIKEIDEILIQIENGEIPIEEIAEKYKEAILKAQNLESELDSLKNEIEILSKNFAQEE